MSIFIKGDFVKVTTQFGGAQYLGAVGIVMRSVDLENEDPDLHTFMVWFGPKDQVPFYRCELVAA